MKKTSGSQKGQKAKKGGLKRRITFSDFGCLSPVTKIVPDKKKEQNRRQCREKTE